MAQTVRNFITIPPSRGWDRGRQMQRARESFHGNMPDICCPVTAFPTPNIVLPPFAVKLWRAIQKNRKLEEQ